jgi:PGF-pre-PGF domain-containing protein
MVGSVLTASGIAQAQTTPEITVEGVSGNELSETETVSLLAQNVGSSDNIGTYQIDVEYNDTLVRLSTSDSDQFIVSENQTGSGPATVTIVGYTGTVDETSGTVELADLELTAGQGTEGNVTQLEITSVSSLTDTDGDDLGNSIVQPGSFEIVEGDEDTDTSDGRTPPFRSGGSDSGDQEPTDDSDSDSPTVEDVRQDLDQTEPNTQTRSEIVDSDPDRPGVNINPEGTESVREITFDDEAAAGNVDITEWQNPPQSVSDSVTGALGEDLSGSAESRVNVYTVADIEPDSEEAKAGSGSVQMVVDRDRFDEDPSDAVIVHEQGDSWEQLETSVDEIDDGEVTLVAETDSFSLFAVAEIDEEAQPQTGDDESTDDSDTTDDGPADDSDTNTDGGIGTGAIVGVLVVLALIVAAFVGYRQME